MRRLVAERARSEREAKKRHRELEQRRKAMEKASALEQARFEVESYESEIDLLLSIHKECRDPIDWHSMASVLPPHDPPQLFRRELAATFNKSLGKVADHAIAEAINQDKKIYAAALAEATTTREEDAGLRALAKRVLAGDSKAYVEAVTRFAPFAEIDSLGTGLGLVVHGPKTVECSLIVNGQHVIPKHMKSLTSSGKLSTKAMPKARFHEVYQDYVCGSVLRVGRELFALLPVETILVTAAVDDTDPITGQPHEIPVLSVCLHRDAFSRLNFDRLDPSGSMAQFLHVGDVMASRRTGTFAPIQPLTVTDLPGHLSEAADSPITARLARAQSCREGIAAAARKITLSSHKTSPAIA